MNTYPTFAAPMMGGMVPNTQMVPKIGNWLPADKLDLIRKNLNQFKLSVTEEEVARGQCNHYNVNGTSALVPDADGIGYTCAICGAHINPQDFSQEDVQNATHNILDILQVIKLMYISIDPQAAMDYFQIIPFIEKIPQLYKIATDDFKKYEGVNTFTPAQQQNPFNIFSMMTNPMAFQQQPTGYYQAPQVAPTPYGAPMTQQPYGYNPLYGQPQVPQQPMMNNGYAAPMANGYQPNPNGYALNPQGAAQPTVNTNMPVQPQAPQAAPTAEAVKVDTNFKK